ncbi:alpha/beta-hydrolase [Mollisia scopiformis]|uniref:Alpha/beta-hydrolase n=1 Tax=Mollisia scopiformis TaxID=149040 RepID=A0A194XDX7_MOLSC|nr:alpha/beta-hydrolase [Mollisia scopiformis]KUJ18390.1 alpha/beta-hydrolase [Mollisia scopiformis]
MFSFRNLIIVLFLALAYAEPLKVRDTRGITQAELNQFELLAQYAGAAYCYDNIQNGTGNTVACTREGGYCPGVEALQTVILDSFFDVGITQTAGYVAIDRSHQLIIVSIQGTSIASNPIDALTDLNIARSKTTLCGKANTVDGCLIHDGFWQAANDVLPIVETTINISLAMNPDFKIVTTGHSLGAAIAALLGAKLRDDGHIVDMYTFGQPSVGAVDVSNYIENQAPAQGNNYRVTHYNDVVPQLPEHNLDWGTWDHYYPEFWISRQNGTVQASDMLVVTGRLYETGGNEGDKTGLGVVVDLIEGLPAHYVYFNPISGCDANAPAAVASSG